MAVVLFKKLNIETGVNTGHPFPRGGKRMRLYPRAYTNALAEASSERAVAPYRPPPAHDGRLVSRKLLARLIDQSSIARDYSVVGDADVANGVSLMGVESCYRFGPCVRISVANACGTRDVIYTTSMRERMKREIANFKKNNFSVMFPRYS